MLGFSVRTVTLWFNQWRDTGGQEGLPGFKVGKSWRADRHEIEEWVQRQKQLSGGPRPAATADSTPIERLRQIR